MEKLGFTQKDIESARLYVQNRSIINTRNICLTKAPHIFSHSTLNIEPALNDVDYLFENSLQNNAFVTHWIFNETGCTTTSCFPTYPLNEFCTSNSVPFSFGLSNGAHLNACQPACFNSKLENLSTDNFITNDHPLPPQLIWFNNNCLMENYALTSFFVDPSKHNINNNTNDDNVKIDATGFDIYVTQLGADGNPVTCARINPEYCKSFYMDFIKDNSNTSLPNDKSCGYEGGTYYLQLLIGSSLIKIVRLTAKAFENAVNVFKNNVLKNNYKKNDIPSFLQHFPISHDYLASVKRWRNNINYTKKLISDDISLNDLGFKNNHLKDRLIWTDYYSHINDGRNDKFGGRLIERQRQIPTNISSEETSTKVEILSKKIVNDVLMPASKRITRDIKNSSNKNQLSENDLINTLQKIIFDLSSMLSKENLKDTSVQFGVDGSNMILSHYLNKIGPLVIETFLKSELFQTGKAFSSKLLSLVISHAIINTIIDITALQVGKTAIALAGISASALNIVGWITLIGPLIDLLFAFVWDPLEFSQPTLSDSLLRKISESNLLYRQIQYGTRQIEMTPYMFWHLHVTDNSQEYKINNTLCTLKHTLIYFSNRKMSSDGSIIDWDIDDFESNSNQVENKINIETAFRQLIIKNMINHESIHYYAKQIKHRKKKINNVFLYAIVGILPGTYIMYINKFPFSLILILYFIIINIVTFKSFHYLFSKTYNNGKKQAFQFSSI